MLALKNTDKISAENFVYIFFAVATCQQFFVING